MQSTSIVFNTSHSLKDENPEDHFISENATLEPIQFTGSMDILNASVVRFWATATVYYNENGRHDSFDFSVPFRPQAEPQSAYYSFIENNIRGGIVRYAAHAVLRNNYTHEEQQYDSDAGQFNIKAIQPSGQLIRTGALNTAISVLCYAKSQFKIFNADHSPVYDNGFGLSRTSNPDAARIWNWKKDLVLFIETYNANLVATRAIPAILRASDPDLYRNLPDFTEEQLKIETWQSFGTGKYFKPKKSTILFITRWSWIPSGESDGFADQCIDIENRVNQGNPPENW